MTTQHSPCDGSVRDSAPASTLSPSPSSSPIASDFPLFQSRSTEAAVRTFSLEGLAGLSDSELLAQLAVIIKQEQSLTVALLLHLGEVELRGLHLASGCSSMFVYCVKRLNFSEDIAYKRVGAARYARRFPLALHLVAQGELHLSALMMVGPHLTDDNHREWLLMACKKSKREVEKLVATRCPKPDVVSSVRRLPEPRSTSGQKASPSHGQEVGAQPGEGVASAGLAQASALSTTQPVADEFELDVPCPIQPAVADATEINVPGPTQSAVTGANQATGTEATQSAAIGASLASVAGDRLAGRPRIQPLSGSSYRVVFTASEALKRKLDRARELCSHCVAPGDLPVLLERAIDLLIEREEKRRYAVGSPKGSNGSNDPLASKNASSSSETVDGTALPTRKLLPAREQDPDPALPGESREPAGSGESDTQSRDPEIGRDGSSLRARESAREFSRHIPAAVRRMVWRRDGGQCTFVDDQGNRCAERQFLQIDHVDPFARGGQATTSNCRLLCRAHNLHHARLTFGTKFLLRAKARSRGR